MARSWKGGEETSIYPHFLSALTQAHGFNYHLYADGSQRCYFQLCPLPSTPDPHILLLPQYLHEDINRHLKLNMSMLNHNFFLPLTPNLLIPSLLLSMRGSGHLSFLLVFHFTMSYPSSNSFGSTFQLYSTSDHFPCPLLPLFCS